MQMDDTSISNYKRAMLLMGLKQREKEGETNWLQVALGKTRKICGEYCYLILTYLMSVQGT